MKTTFLLLFVLVIFAACEKDEPSGTTSTEPTDKFYQRIYELPDHHPYPSAFGNKNCALLAADGNLLLLSQDGQMLKVSKEGDVIWQSDCSSLPLQPYLCSVVEAPNQDVFVCGYSSTNSVSTAGSKDIVLMGLNALGHIVWQKSYGYELDDVAQKMIFTSDGNLLIGGTSGFQADSLARIYLLKLNTNGDTLWTRRFDIPDMTNEATYDLLKTQAGDYLLTCSNVFVKVKANGDLGWQQPFSAQAIKSPRGTIELSNGDLLVCGVEETNRAGLLKCDRNGNKIWAHTFGEVDESAYAAAQNSDGTITVVCDSGRDALVLNVDEQGNEQWTKKLDVSDWLDAKCLLKDTNDDNLILGQYYQDPGYGALGPPSYAGIFLCRTDADGNPR